MESNLGENTITWMPQTTNTIGSAIPLSCCLQGMPRVQLTITAMVNVYGTYEKVMKNIDVAPLGTRSSYVTEKRVKYIL